jgi:HSP20 family protein
MTEPVETLQRKGVFMSQTPQQTGRKNPRQTEERFAIPPVDIREEADEFVLIADMPGVTKEGLEVTLDANELTLVGHRSPATENREYLHRESRRPSYRRVFEIAPEIDAGRITAHIADGVLTVRLPKAEALKPRKIAITTD